MAMQTSDPAAWQATGGRTLTRLQEYAVAFFGTWMITGLFMDGWAHRAGLPETFFSPWHAVLYSGFAAGVAFFALEPWITRRRGAMVGMPSSPDRLMAWGLGIFVAGASGDFVWHAIFGIEVNLEALLSPSHLMLMIGGLLMVTGPVRSAWRDPAEAVPGWRSFAPAIVTMTLGTALLSFFLMYLSAFIMFAPAQPGELFEVIGVASVLVTNALLMAPVFLALRRWTPPFGSFTLLFSGVAIATSGLDAFDAILLALPAPLAGLAADVLVHTLRPSAVRRGAARIVGAGVPVVLWSGWFALGHIAYGMVWTPELWAGSIVLAALTGVGLSILVFPPPGPAPTTR